jgi:glycosyltransferase involved in cell wall biosynthesis
MFYFSANFLYFVLMIHPKVSVVVCTYNGERFLRQQLDSIISQTYPNLEIIISDDNSTDGTVPIAKSYQAKDQRIKIHLNTHNLGYNRNFEQGFDLATGNFIAVCDQDDIWKTNKIEAMMPLFKDGALLVYCRSVRFRNETPDVEKYCRRKLFIGNDIKRLMYVNDIAGHNIIFKKELLQYAKPFPEGVFYDWWLTIVAAVFGVIRATDNVYTFHRWHNTNATLRKRDQKIQTKAAALARSVMVQNILKIEALEKEDYIFAKKLYEALKTIQGRRFSVTLLIFLLRHSRTLFFFKKQPWSRAKMACRLSFAID